MFLSRPFPQVEDFIIWLVLLMAYGDPRSDVGNLEDPGSTQLPTSHPSMEHGNCQASLSSSGTWCAAPKA